MLTPLDVQNKEFTKSVRGYNAVDVDDYLAIIVKSMESLINVNIELTGKITELEKELSRYKEIEETLNNSLLLAQKTSDDAIFNATEKSKFIIDKAENDAQKIIDSASNEVLVIQRRYEDIKSQYQNFLIKNKSVLQSQLSLLESEIHGDMSKND